MKSSLFDKDYYSSDNYNDYLTGYKKEGEEFVKLLLGLIKLKPEAKILDVGCGMGGVIKAFRELGFEAFGTEVSEYCLKKSPVKKFIQKIGVTSLPFEDNFFDLVICQDVLCYLNRKQVHQAVNELVGVTKDYLYIEVITKGSPNSRQSVNPDKLRKAENLLAKREWFKLLSLKGLKPLKKVYLTKDNPDFNYLFKK
ncbi:class I SAM-dependent methyltransferase [Patescibacteria group bacterium]|nr:class I SAM-dependent methyltransferase [Patescibacteria group bacterium]